MRWIHLADQAGRSVEFVECSTCAAIVASDALERHREWHGEAPPVVVDVKLDDSPEGREALVKAIRQAVRRTGGGDAQRALGSGS